MLLRAKTVKFSIQVHILSIIYCASCRSPAAENSGGDAGNFRSIRAYTLYYINLRFRKDRYYVRNSRSYRFQ